MTCQILGCFYAIHFIAVKLGANHVTIVLLVNQIIVLLVKFGFEGHFYRAFSAVC
jgi:hypothetical protein